MRLNKMLLAGLLVLGVANTQAATKEHTVKYRLAIQEDDRLVHETRHQPYQFRVEIVSDDEGVKPETYRNGRPFITASRGENYSVRLYNPLPVRVAVNLTVDGLNSITGKPSGISDGQKWVIDPYSSVTIPGWQVSGEEARRFFFTNKPKSYAQWRGNEMGKDLAANCGVIGAAYFWNQDELNQYYDSHPIYRYSQQPYPYNSYRAKAYDSLCAPPAPACTSGMMERKAKKEAPEEQAGTGMGERESNPTYQVSFDYNAGMYSLDQAVVIYYDFAKTPRPNPFPDLSFAPEMPLH